MRQTRTAIHIYQRSEGHVVLFYTRSDLLSFYTIMSICAKRTGVKVLAVAIMYDHVHILIEAGSRGEVTQFVQMYSSMYAVEFNNASGVSGRVFEKPFGSAVKRGEKEIRTCAGYIYNNHTNKRLCDRAEDIRWNFLAYAESSNPFSPQLFKDKSRRKLRSALCVVQSEQVAGHYLNHATLRRIFTGLNRTEAEQITDFIINKYRFIDYEALKSLYRSYEEMVYSFNANTFNDYDISESSRDRRGDDTVFREMARHIASLGIYKSIKNVLSLPEDLKLGLASELKVITRASWRQIGKYLRIKVSAARPEDLDYPPPCPAWTGA